MIATLRRTLRELRSHTSGNAMMMVGIGLPALVGGSGLAVDISQWYMWKRELQYAADQAALAGAWAKASTDTTVQQTYSTRAQQEYDANVDTSNVKAIDAAPVITNPIYGNGTSANSVLVTVTASKKLPFSSILTGKTTTVFVKAQAIYAVAVPGTTTTTTIPAVSACMTALHPTAQGAFTIGGSADGLVTCGGATLSTHTLAAIEEDGDGGGNATVARSAQFGTLSAAGKIESTLLNNVNNVLANLNENQSGMANPYAGIATPTGSGTTRTYSCPTAQAATAGYWTYNATSRLRTKVTYAYKRGSNSGSATTITYPSGSTGYLADTDDNPGVDSAISRTSAAYAASGPTQAGPNTDSAVKVAGNGQSSIWRFKTTTTWTTITPGTSVYTAGTAGNDGIARPEPGTYSSITISCQTQFQPGIYVITGGLDFSQNQTVSGNDVLFVMGSNQDIGNINSNTNITLSGITAQTLTQTYGYSTTDAAKLAGMLFWDPLGESEIKFNGNASIKLNGIIYTPKRPLWFNGTASVTGNCMMLVANTLKFTGNINVGSFCTPSGTTTPVLREETTTTTTTAGTAASVKLVV